jgi:hypothetical protein
VLIALLAVGDGVFEVHSTARDTHPGATTLTNGWWIGLTLEVLPIRAGVHPALVEGSWSLGFFVRSGGPN